MATRVHLNKLIKKKKNKIIFNKKQKKKKKKKKEGVAYHPQRWPSGHSWTFREWPDGHPRGGLGWQRATLDGH
jgi:hypothetical protein